MRYEIRNIHEDITLYQDANRGSFLNCRATSELTLKLLSHLLRIDAYSGSTT